MARAACTQIAMRTTVMIGALLVLLMVALLPGPVRWLLGSQHRPAAGGDDLVRRPTSGSAGSSPITETVGAGLGTEFAGAAAGASADATGANTPAANLSQKRAAEDPLPGSASGAGEGK